MQNVSLSDRPDYVATYEQVVEKASRVKSLLESRQIRLNSASVLGQLRISAHRGRHFRLIVDAISG